MDVNENSFQELSEMLKSTDSEVRKEAVLGLAQFETPQAAELLLNALNDEDGDVILYAVGVLRERKYERTKDAVLKLIKQPTKHTSWGGSLKIYLIMELANCDPDEAVIDTLISELGDEDSEVGHWASKTLLGFAGLKLPLSRFIELLKSDSANTKYYAIHILGELGKKEGIEPLIGAAGDDEIRIREQAAFVLGKLDAVELLIQALEDSSYQIRQAAAFALGKLGDKRAVQPLIKLILDPRSEVGCTALEALGHIGDPRAIAPITSLLRKDYPGAPYHSGFIGNLRYTACKALAEVGTTEELPLLHSLIQNDKGRTLGGVSVQVAAAYALDEIEKRERQKKSGI